MDDCLATHIDLETHFIRGKSTATCPAGMSMRTKDPSAFRRIDLQSWITGLLGLPAARRNPVVYAKRSFAGTSFAPHNNLESHTDYRVVSPVVALSRDWLDGFDTATQREWAAVAEERIRQIESGEVAPLDGEQVLEEMRQLAKQLAQQ